MSFCLDFSSPSPLLAVNGLSHPLAEEVVGVLSNLHQSREQLKEQLFVTLVHLNSNVGLGEREQLQAAIPGTVSGTAAPAWGFSANGYLNNFPETELWESLLGCLVWLV